MDARDILRRAKVLHKEQEGKLPIEFRVLIGGEAFGSGFYGEIEAAAVEEPEAVPEVVPTITQDEPTQNNPVNETGKKEPESKFIVDRGGRHESMSEKLTRMGY
jgi:hypothetical protein